MSVTALMPGATETNFFHRAGMDDTKVGASEKDDAAEVAKEGSRRLWQAKTASSPGLSKTSFSSRRARWRRKQRLRCIANKLNPGNPEKDSLSPAERPALCSNL